MHRINHACLIAEMGLCSEILKQRVAMHDIDCVKVGLEQSLCLHLMCDDPAWIEHTKWRTVIAENLEPVLADQFRLAFGATGSNEPNLMTLPGQIMCFVKCQAICATWIVRVVVTR